MSATYLSQEKAYRSHNSRYSLPDFEIVICRTISEIKKCLNVRYNVYCLRKEWESADSFPDRLETDDFDEAAVHILLKDRRSGKAVGTARVIYADPNADHGGLPSFGWSAEFRERAEQLFPIRSTVELSRLAIARESDGPAQLRSSMPLLGLIKGLCRATASDDVGTVCLTTTLALKRMLESFGIRLHDVGVRIEHRGVRAPLYRDIPALLGELHQLRPEIWRYLTDDGETWPLNRAALANERASPAL